MKINQEFPRFFPIQNPKSHFTIIFLDEVVGFIIVNVIRHLLYQRRLRPVVVVVGICVIGFYSVGCTVTLSVGA